MDTLYYSPSAGEVSPILVNALWTIPQFLARIFHTPSLCQDRPGIIDRRGGRRLLDMRAKSQTDLPELAEEKRPRHKSVFTSNASACKVTFAKMT